MQMRGVQRFQLRKYAKQVINCSAAVILKELQEAVIGVDNGEIECSRFIHAGTHEEKKQEEKVLFGEAVFRGKEKGVGLVPSAE